MASCLVGAAFVDCGTGTPALRCSKASQECKWVSDGDPVGDLTARGDTSDCSCSGDCPPKTAVLGFVVARGAQPWTRSRAMALSVRVEGVAAEVPAVKCKTCTGSCKVADYSPCTGRVESTKKLPGTYVVELKPSSIGFDGWHLELEVDVARSPMRARACRLVGSDSFSCKDRAPVCATSGEVVLSRVPTPEASAAHGRFSAVFSDAEMSGIF